jgi:hypothetical protein
MIVNFNEKRYGPKQNGETPYLSLQANRKLLANKYHIRQPNQMDVSYPSTVTLL